MDDMDQAKGKDLCKHIKFKRENRDIETDILVTTAKISICMAHIAIVEEYHENIDSVEMNPVISRRISEFRKPGRPSPITAWISGELQAFCKESSLSLSLPDACLMPA
jgi:hypothetical protein